MKNLIRLSILFLGMFNVAIAAPQLNTDQQQLAHREEGHHDDSRDMRRDDDRRDDMRRDDRGDERRRGNINVDYNGSGGGIPYDDGDDSNDNGNSNNNNTNGSNSNNSSNNN